MLSKPLFHRAIMIRQLRLSLTPFLLMMCIASTAPAQLEMWLSSSDDAAAANAAIAPEITNVLGSTSEVYLWAKPEAGKTLENFSLNVLASDEAIVSFDGIEIQNGTDANRFEFLFDTSNGLDVDDQVRCLLDDTSIFDLEDDTTEAIWGFRGFTLSSDDVTGIVAEDGTAVHLATISVGSMTLGNADLYLQVGEVGINHAGETSEVLEVQFGPGDDLLDASGDRCQSSATADISIEVVEGLLGDFNSNGVLDANDIDLLSEQARSGTATASFELNGDAAVNESDRTFWVESLRKTYFGDADLNGKVDFTDFLAMNVNYPGAGGWADGDFNGDQLVGFPDFLLLNAFFGFPDAGEAISAEAVATVPEPVWSPLSLLVLFVVLIIRRR